MGRMLREGWRGGTRWSSWTCGLNAGYACRINQTMGWTRVFDGMARQHSSRYGTCYAHTMKTCMREDCRRKVGAYGDRWCSRCRFQMMAPRHRPRSPPTRAGGGFSSRGTISNPVTSVDAFMRSGQLKQPT